MSNIHIILAKEAKPCKHYKKKDNKTESQSIKKIKENLVKMEKGFIKGISLSSVRLTLRVHTFIEENNLEIADEMIRLRR